MFTFYFTKLSDIFCENCYDVNPMMRTDELSEVLNVNIEDEDVDTDEESEDEDAE